MGQDLTCPFCHPLPPDIVLRSHHCYARWDKFPVTEGHLLIIPDRHFADYFEATHAEKADLWAFVDECQAFLMERYHPDGFNVGINVGSAAGQTIGHVHIHLIPRRKGDMEHPRGGVRHVIPSKGNY